MVYSYPLASSLPSLTVWGGGWETDTEATCLGSLASIFIKSSVRYKENYTLTSM